MKKLIKLFLGIAFTLVIFVACSDDNKPVEIPLDSYDVDVSTVDSIQTIISPFIFNAEVIEDNNNPGAQTFAWDFNGDQVWDIDAKPDKQVKWKFSATGVFTVTMGFYIGGAYIDSYTTQVVVEPITAVVTTNDAEGTLLDKFSAVATVFGVIELASFGTFQNYKIDFVEKICESIASTISVIKNNEHTEKLLEESQILANQLSAQEEEMRQTLEEMQATQEEMSMQQMEEKEKDDKEKNNYLSELKRLKRKVEDNDEIINNQNIKFQNIQQSINNSIGMAYLTFDGEFIDLNDKYLTQTELTKEQVVGQNMRNFLSKEISESEAYSIFWENLKQGNIQSAKHHYFFGNKEIWLYETFTPVKNEKQEWIQIILVSYNVSKVEPENIIVTQ